MKYKTLKSSILKKASQKRIPVLCEFELTSNCNFSCPMCFVCNKDQNLDTNTWLGIFSDAYKAGMMFANLTGGELFLRRDFNTLYNYLFDKGIKLTLFTNGSILTQETLELLSKKKPHYIAITLYGWDETSYASFTGVKNVFNQVMSNIKRLKKHDINLILRTTPIKSIYQNLDKVISLAKSLGEDLQYFTYLTRVNVNDDNNQRLSPKEVLDFELQLNEAFGYSSKEQRFEDTYLSCSALRSALYINHLGEMIPCSYASRPKKSILNNDFYQTFISLGDELLALESKNPCHDCKHLNNCLSCFARRQSEEGVLKCANYLKAIAKEKETYYQICGLNFKVENIYWDTFFKDNIEKYRSNQVLSDPYVIKTHIIDTFDIPNVKPYSIFSSRKMYRDEHYDYIISFSEDNQVKQVYRRTHDYKRYDLFFNQQYLDKLDEREYIFSGIAFMDIVSMHGFVPIHGSALIYQDEGIIFSAPSKTGKSTLAQRFIKVYNEAKIINDDKPIIYQSNKKLMISGTPWAGKSALNQNVEVPLKAIVFLAQGKKDDINVLNQKEALKALMRNISRPKDDDAWAKIEHTLTMMLESITFYQAIVTNTINAAKVVYHELYGGSKVES